MQFFSKATGTERTKQQESKNRWANEKNSFKKEKMKREKCDGMLSHAFHRKFEIQTHATFFSVVSCLFTTGLFTTEQ